MERIRETKGAILSGENTKDKEFDELHLIYLNKDLILREKYDISKDETYKFLDITKGYEKFIKLILQYEVDKK